MTYTVIFSEKNNFWLNSFGFLLYIFVCMCIDKNMHIYYISQRKYWINNSDWTCVFTHLETDFPSAELQIEMQIKLIKTKFAF